MPYLLLRGSAASLNPVLLQLSRKFSFTVARKPFPLPPHELCASMVRGGSCKTEITFRTTPGIAKAGLDRITLTIPPSSVANMISNVTRHAAGGSNLILSAIEEWGREAFKIDLSCFQVERIRGELGTVGVDGRIKVGRSRGKNGRGGMLETIGGIVKREMNRLGEGDLAEKLGDGGTKVTPNVNI